MQLAGYPSVLGTLWQVNDRHSAEVIRDVYSYMLERNIVHTQRSSEALHRAIRLLRERSRIISGFTKNASSDPLIWAQYIHLGV